MKYVVDFDYILKKFVFFLHKQTKNGTKITKKLKIYCLKVILC